MCCPECGTENKDTANFCLDCGKSLKKIVQDNTQKNSMRSTNVKLIVIGVIIILSMYLIPIPGNNS
jgi:uncharacterized membrane protein YvbJ